LPRRDLSRASGGRGSLTSATTRSSRWSWRRPPAQPSPIAFPLAWNLARPGIVSPIIGPKTEQQLKDNLAALEVDLPAEAIERIDAAASPTCPIRTTSCAWRGS
jgi:aryl-alcohol dehydrogenase-like predicted oxidoreductase